MPHIVSVTRLIVNADDFGLTEGINRAIGELFQAGVLTSATLMANGAAFQHAVQTAKRNPGLAIGCHVVLVDGTAVAEPGSVASLLTPQGRLRNSLLGFIVDLQRGRISDAEIEAEAVAQIQRVQNAGILVTHVDTHKHTHLSPRIAEPLLRAAKQCGVPAVRNPFEPAWSARLTRGALVRRLEVALLSNFDSSFGRLCSQYGIAATAGCIGVSATGQLNDQTLRALLRSAPEGTYELVCHPGYNDAALAAIRTRLRDTRETERQALLSQLPSAIGSGRIQLLNFGDLA